MGLFGNKKSPEEKQRETEINEILSRFDGGILSNSPYFDFIAHDYVEIHESGNVSFANGNFKSILKKEMLNEKLSENNLEKRVIELLQLDWTHLFFNKNKVDTSIFHTQNDIIEYFGDKYNSDKFIKNQEKIKNSHIKFKEKQEKKKQENIEKNDYNNEIKRIMDNGYYKCKFGYYNINQNDINEIIELEIEKNVLVIENIEDRVNELIDEKENLDEIKEELMKISPIEDKSSGIDDENKNFNETIDNSKTLKNKNAEKNEYDFSCDIEEIRTNWAGEKRKDRRKCNVKVLDDRVILYKTGVFIKSDLGNRTVYFSDITGIDFDKAGLFHITDSINIVIKGGENITLIYVKEENFNLINSKWTEYKKNIDKPQNTTILETRPTETLSIADELAKYAELYEKGVLTEDEFIAIKQNLIGNSIESPKFYCTNCGAEISDDSKFCSNCGNPVE